ncbi:putative membrane protein [Methanosarcina siciliae T4/M]|uniref:Putative membrane protein n=2 Tax=Methanosarcina siciliae TaxID=38027 RepID=A0A0E3P5L8_9EURY|nr:putative membrane protein [Methanosarcina siciliae T4/M]
MIEDLSKQQLITLQDAAIVSWPMGKKKPKTKQLTSMTGVGALSGAFWGMLFGLIFLVPIFGMVVGAAIGALSASFADVGISDDFIKSVRSKVTEGTSALFLLTSDAVQDKVVEATRGMKFELIASNLSKEEEDKLREVFAEEEEAAAPAH